MVEPRRTEKDNYKNLGKEEVILRKGAGGEEKSKQQPRQNFHLRWTCKQKAPYSTKVNTIHVKNIVTTEI